MVNQKGNISIVLGGILLVLVVGMGTFVLGQRMSNQNIISNGDSQLTKINNITQLTKSDTTQDEVDDWISYKIPTLNLEFKLPRKVSSALGSLEEEIVEGQTGSQLCGQFIKKSAFVSTVFAGGVCITKENPYLRLGTTSVDYSAGREGMFTDFQGFVYEDGKYLQKFVSQKAVDAFPQERISKVENKNGVEIIKIIGTTKLDEGPTMLNSLGNRTGALINTKDQKYTGLALMFEENGLSEKEINQVLNTFRFIN